GLTDAGVRGILRGITPVASKNAATMAIGAAELAASPPLLMPRSLRDVNTVLISGTSCMRGIRYLVQSVLVTRLESNVTSSNNASPRPMTAPPCSIDVRWRGFMTLPTSTPIVSCVTRTTPVLGTTSISAMATHGALLRRIVPTPRPLIGVDPVLRASGLGEGRDAHPAA